MSSFDLVNVLLRFVHVAGAAVAVGAVAATTARGLPPAAFVGLRRLFHIGAGLALASGFYNYLVVAIPALQDTGFSGGYHPLMGMKILLAAAFVVAGTIGFRRAESNPIPARAVLLMTLFLGLAILMLGAYLRRLWATG